MHNKYRYVVRYPKQLWNTDIMTKEFAEGLGIEGSFNSILCLEGRIKYQNFGKKEA
jgi:hypothetical protein